MIYDCFTFFNEIELLEIRLNVLNDVVDKFVLVEMNKTHIGNDKPFYFEENKERFADFSEKIIHIKVCDTPALQTSENDQYGNKWLLENFQRDEIMRGLVNADAEDIIIISDLDEIPNPDTIARYRDKEVHGVWVLEQMLMYYFLNNICATAPIWRSGSRIGRYADLLDPKQDLAIKEYYQFSQKGRPTYFRFCRGKRIKDAGWHFSFLGGLEAIIKKRQAIVEQQFNTTENMDYEHIKEAIANGLDIYGRKHMYMAIDLDSAFPRYILENQNKYKHLIFEVDAAYQERIKGLKQKLFIRKWIRKPLLIVLASVIPVKAWRRKIRDWI